MKNRTVATLLAFFLGGFGIHKFYLEENLSGILYLIFSWTFIPSLIAFFEFIGFLIMSDDVFNAKYNSKYFNVMPSAHPLGTAQDKVATLAELKKLYDSGIITAEEYEQKRRKYLDSL